MIIAALNERPLDSRVAITPSAIKLYKKIGLDVYCESQAGQLAGFSNDDYHQAGATLLDARRELLEKAEIIVSVAPLSLSDIKLLPSDSLLIGPYDNESSEAIELACEKNITIFSMNHIPRISRAQSMDSLSSQANLAGYRAVIEGVSHFNRAIPMMMTAAGMIHPAKILVLGAGVAGLQAIATAKRLGAIVYAFDVRKAAKEQVESLGAEFIEVLEDHDSETTTGYANEASEDYKRLQADLIEQYAKQSDIVISTALIPQKKAPLLLTKRTVECMKKGSIIVDLATSRGGNCELSIKDEIIDHEGVKIIGTSNMAGLIPATASELYAMNLYNFIRTIISSSTEITFDADDEIIKQGILCHQGATLPFQIKE